MNIQITCRGAVMGIIALLYLFLSVSHTEANTDESRDTAVPESEDTKSLRALKRSQFITEASFMLRVNRSPDDYIEQEENNFYYWTGDLGYLVKVSSVTGVGGTLFFGADHDGARMGVRARIRRWLRNGLTLDFAPGLFLNVFDNNVGSYPNPFFSIALRHASGISAVVQVDRIAYDGDEIVFISPPSTYGTIRKKQTAFYLGISIDRNAGKTAFILGWVLVALGGAASSG